MKSEARFILENNTHFIEFPLSQEGAERARRYRAKYSDFKGRNVKYHLQENPARFKIGRRYPVAN